MWNIGDCAFFIYIEVYRLFILRLSVLNNQYRTESSAMEKDIDQNRG